MDTWYSTLDRPPLTPPNWVFSPVWAILYAMIAVSIVTYYRSRETQHPAVTTIVLVIHLITNFAWTYLFFGLRSPGAALIDIIVLDVTLLVLIVWFWKARPLSGVLLLPYMAWVLFATYLNCGFYMLNR